jgi:sugar phosphate isomerase/epimerase
MVAVSGTFNMIHPDLEKRRADLHRFGVLASACRDMGTGIITLCTGTRDPENMWRGHPDNDRLEAWNDLGDSMCAALEIAEKADVVLAFEPETSNVIDSAAKASELLSQLNSPRLTVVIDPANLFRRGDLFRMHEIVADAFGKLRPDIVLAHAKDVRQGRAALEVEHVAAGKGLLDYDHYLSCLHKLDRDVALILHGLDEAEVGEALAYVRKKALWPPTRGPEPYVPTEPPA